ncbi:hypothetical protein [Pseudoxanthomonas sp. Root630]|uniref:hypothetical protein n=1 Tax=Pseudoxanthomonas sp. Root630 TaxID=1736574 RepID=UPI001F3A3175|nr:hypothetical protein [Pseudoxanthomonas sp. Root630]
MQSNSKGRAAASVQYAQSAPIGMPGGDGAFSIGELPVGDPARVSTHVMPPVVHSSVQPASTCVPALATQRVTDGANAISSAASMANRSIGRRKEDERITAAW